MSTVPAVCPRPGPSVGPSSAEELDLADGELNPREAERVVWDVIVVGTGMGGGMLGYRLAQLRPQGAVRREGALDTARDAGNDPRCDA